MRLSPILLALGAILLTLPWGSGQAAGRPAAIYRLSPAVMRGAASPLSTVAQLQSAAFPGSQTIMISGVLGTNRSSAAFVAESRDGGRHWHLRARLSGYRMWTLLTFRNRERGWAVASPDPSSRAGVAVPDQIDHTSDGGRRWTRVAQVPGRISSLTLAPGGGVWVGIEGTCSAESCAGAVLSAGISGWRTLWTAPGPVLALDRQRRAVLAEVGETGRQRVTVSVYRTTDQGRSWTTLGVVAQYPAPQPAALSPMSGELVAAPGGTMVTSVYAPATCSMGGCTISAVYGSENDGATWVPRPQATIPCQFAPVLASRGSTVVVEESVNLAACPGPGTRLFLSRDGGAHFVPWVQWAGAGGDLGFTPQGALWSLHGPALTVSRDQGRTWRQIFPVLTPTEGIAYGGSRALYGFGDVADPGAVLRSHDGGRSWQVVSSLGFRQVVGAAFLNAHQGFVAAIPQPGTLQLASLVLATDSGGRHWTAVFRPHAGQALFPVIRFFSHERAVLLNLAADCPGVCPAGAQTEDAGQHWPSLPAVRGPIRHGVAGAILSPRHFVLVTLGSPSQASGMYATADAGRHWHRLLQLPSEIQVFGPTLTFPTTGTGYLIVNDVQRPVVKQPGKPFRPELARLALMKTTNGGRTWTLRDLPGLPAFGPASLAWQTARIGWLEVGGEVWKTTDGGARWTLES